MNYQETDSTSWSNTQISALLSLGLMNPGDDEDNSEQTRDLMAKLKADRSGKYLRAVVRDLKTPLDENQRGPLSLSRLLGLPRDQLRQLHGRTYIEALMARRISRASLEAMLRFSELLISECFPARTRITGAVTRLLVLAAVDSRYGVHMELPDAGMLTTLSQLLTTQPQSTKFLRDSIDSIRPSGKT